MFVQASDGSNRMTNMYFAAAVYLGTFADSRSFELVFLVVVFSVSDTSHSQHECDDACIQKIRYFFHIVEDFVFNVL